MGGGRSALVVFVRQVIPETQQS